MDKKITAFLAVIFTSMFSLTTTLEAQTVNTQVLSPKQQSIVTIAAFTANGDLQKLKTALNEGLDTGLTVNEIKEVLVQMYAYCGFPRSLNGISTFMSLMEEQVSLHGPVYFFHHADGGWIEPRSAELPS